MLKNALTAFRDPIGITVSILELAADTLGRHSHLQARDALHAAVVIHHGLEGVVTADRGFDDIPGLTRFDPRDI